MTEEDIRRIIREELAAHAYRERVRCRQCGKTEGPCMIHFCRWGMPDSQNWNGIA